MPPQEGLERVSAAAASESGSGAESTGIDQINLKSLVSFESLVLFHDTAKDSE